MKKFIYENIIMNKQLIRYALLAFLVGSISMMIAYGWKALLIVIPLSFVAASWQFYASGSFETMKQGAYMINAYRDASKKEKEEKK